MLRLPELGEVRDVRGAFSPESDPSLKMVQKHLIRSGQVRIEVWLSPGLLRVLEHAKKLD